MNYYLSGSPSLCEIDCSLKILLLFLWSCSLLTMNFLGQFPASCWLFDECDNFHFFCALELVFNLKLSIFLFISISIGWWTCIKWCDGPWITIWWRLQQYNCEFSSIVLLSFYPILCISNLCNVADFCGRNWFWCHWWGSQAAVFAIRWSCFCENTSWKRMCICTIR